MNRYERIAKKLEADSGDIPMYLNVSDVFEDSEVWVDLKPEDVAHMKKKIEDAITPDVFYAILDVVIRNLKRDRSFKEWMDKKGIRLSQ